MTATTRQKPYLQIVRHYENCLADHGDSHLGVDWPNQPDALTRYQVMLDVIKPAHQHTHLTLLDFGCGASHLYEYLRARRMDWVDYAGLDLSAQFIALSRAKFPDRCYYQLDMLDQPAASLPMFDYIVLNGVLTEKRELTFDEMWDYARRLLQAVLAKARVGIAFNVMSQQVDWQRDDLFHLSLDRLGNYLTRELSRHFVIRNDYGLYEYTTYIYHESAATDQGAA
jgi:SAM-dependent methyltransferase